jgi:hypothetical protein
MAFNQKDLIPAPDAATQAIFDQGHEVGLDLDAAGKSCRARAPTSW